MCHLPLWGIVKKQMFCSQPKDLDELKSLIENAFYVCNEDKLLLLHICKKLEVIV